MEMSDFKKVYQYSKDLNILYVEDDLNLLHETTDILEDFFKSVTTAQNGMEGIEKYKDYLEKNENYFDLVITDINMPRLDGIGMIKEISKINSSQSIIVLSAYNETDRLINLIHLGIANFIMKPIKPKELIEIIHKTCINISNQKHKDEFLLQQSRLAQMGEIVDSIAHQWLQPINIIRMDTNNLLLKNILGSIDVNFIEDYTKSQFKQIDFMVETLREFRNFMRPSISSQLVSYNKMLKSVLLLLDNHIRKNNIQIKLDINENHKVQVVVNEFKHILINIINNAVDAFNENGSDYKNRILSFKTSIKNDNMILNICDNAGGIDPQIIKQIFNSNVTTKSKDKGTGMGLYLSYLIIKKNNGKIGAKNCDNGACFKISIKKEQNET